MIMFVDSSALIALSDKDDQYFRNAVDFVEGIADQCKFVTSNFILDETVNHLNSRLGTQAAYSFGDAMLESSLYEVVDIDRILFREGLQLLRKFHDKRFSFTDLTSFALMRLRRIHKAFTFDRDFVKAGFEIVPSL